MEFDNVGTLNEKLENALEVVRIISAIYPNKANIDIITTAYKLAEGTRDSLLVLLINIEEFIKNIET